MHDWVIILEFSNILIRLSPCPLAQPFGTASLILKLIIHLVEIKRLAKSWEPKLLSSYSSGCPFLNFGFLETGRVWLNITFSRFCKREFWLWLMSFKYRNLLKGFSRGVDASAMNSYTNPSRESSIGMGPPSANPRWQPFPSLTRICPHWDQHSVQRPSGDPSYLVLYVFGILFEIQFKTCILFHLGREEILKFRILFTSYCFAW